MTPPFPVRPVGPFSSVAAPVAARQGIGRGWTFGAGTTAALFLSCALACQTAGGKALRSDSSSDSAMNSAGAAAEDIRVHTLPNGLTVILVPNPVVPLVTVQIAVKNGAFVETPDYDGLAHFYEHMFFKGNAAIPTQEAYMERLRELGIDFNGYTSAEAVRYFFTLPAYNTAAGLQFMLDAITTPLFEAAEIKKEIGAVMGEFDRAESQPGFRFHQEMNKAVWWKYPERKDPLGSRDVVRGVTVEQLKTLQRRYYVPNNSALLIAGDIDPAAVLADVEKRYAVWERGADPFVEHPIPAHPPLAESSALVVHEAVKSPAVQVVWHGPSVNDDPGATYAADVLSRALSSRASKFQKALVDSGLAQGADFSYFTQAYVGPVGLRLRADGAKLTQALQVALAELPRFADPDYLTDAELERAKLGIIRETAYEREKVQDFSITLGFWWCSASIDYFVSYPDRIAEVTRDDIRRFLSQYVWGKPSVTGVMISAEDDAAHLKDFPARRVVAPAPEAP